MKRLSLISACAFSLAVSSAGAAYISVNGNDTGGIIPWSPVAEQIMAGLSDAHCRQYNKVAFITSVHRSEGDYIGFVCAFPRDYDPVKARPWGWPLRRAN